MRPSSDRKFQRVEAFQQRDRRRFPRCRRERGGDRCARAVALHMHDAGAGMRSFAAQSELARARRGRTARHNAEGLRCGPDASRASSAAILGSLRPAPAATVSAAWRFGGIAFSKRGRDAALRPGARTRSARPSAGNHQSREGGKLQRGEQARHARAQNERALRFDDVIGADHMA